MMKFLDKGVENLSEDKIILYPTDTVWGLGCDATSTIAVEKIYVLKQRSESKALIILVSSIAMLKRYVDVSSKVEQLINSSEKPTTIIYSNPKGLADNLLNIEDNTVAIRIVKDQFCKDLIDKFGKPIVSTSANISGNNTPSSFSEIDQAILKGVDYIVNLRTDEVSSKSSTILKVTGDHIVVIRE